MSTPYERCQDAIAGREDREQVTISDVLSLSTEQFQKLALLNGKAIPDEELRTWERLTITERLAFLVSHNPEAPL